MFSLVGHILRALSITKWQSLAETFSKNRSEDLTWKSALFTISPANLSISLEHRVTEHQNCFKQCLVSFKWRTVVAYCTLTHRKRKKGILVLFFTWIWLPPTTWIKHTLKGLQEFQLKTRESQKSPHRGLRFDNTYFSSHNGCEDVHNKSISTLNTSRAKVFVFLVLVLYVKWERAAVSINITINVVHHFALLKRGSFEPKLMQLSILCILTLCLRYYCR